MYIFHLVLCYDMKYFFVVSINIYLTWLDLNYQRNKTDEDELIKSLI